MAAQLWDQLLDIIVPTLSILPQCLYAAFLEHGSLTQCNIPVLSHQTIQKVYNSIIMIIIAKEQQACYDYSIGTEILS